MSAIVIVYGYREVGVYADGELQIRGVDIELHDLLSSLEGETIGTVQTRHLNDDGNGWVTEDMPDWPSLLEDIPAEFFV